MALEAAYYLKGDAFQIEKRTVFAREWLPIAVQEQLARPGQYVAAAIGGWPMLAVRGTDGVTRAFRNLCRHQDRELAERDAGICENFRCRFHGWTYDLAGAFVDAPPLVMPTGDKSEQGLTPVALQQRGSVVMVNLKADATPLAGVAVPSQPTQGQSYAGARLIDIGCNWKTLLERVLPDDSIAWQWPALLMRAQGDVTLIDQIVPRTFLRTRVVRHAYVSNGEAAATQVLRAEFDALKARAEQLQSTRAQGIPADTSHARVADLHARLADAYARDVAANAAG